MPLIKHGHAFKNKFTRTYRTWCNIKVRCLYKGHKDYPLYGGSGITVCERWMTSFANFLTDMGEAPPGLQIDRKDGTNGYEPGNCRWVTTKEQARNKRTAHMVTYKGKMVNLDDAESEMGFCKGSFRMWLWRHPEFKGDVSTVKLIVKPGFVRQFFTVVPLDTPP